MFYPTCLFFFATIFDLFRDALGVLELLHSSKNNSDVFINYVCGEDPFCDVELTGPSWKTALKLSTQSMRPNVRMCDAE